MKSKKISVLLVAITILCLLFACLEADEPTKTMPANPIAQKLMQKVAAAKEEIPSVEIEKLKSMMETPGEIRLIDVRTRAEYDQGHIAGAEWFSRGTIDFDAMKGKLGDIGESYILYCKKSPRAVLAAQSLKDIGYLNVSILTDGFLGWIKAGNSIYNRHGEVKIVEFEKKETE